MRKVSKATCINGLHHLNSPCCFSDSYEAPVQLPATLLPCAGDPGPYSRRTVSAPDSQSAALLANGPGGLVSALNPWKVSPPSGPSQQVQQGTLPTHMFFEPLRTSPMNSLARNQAAALAGAVMAAGEDMGGHSGHGSPSAAAFHLVDHPGVHHSGGGSSGAGAAGSFAISPPLAGSSSGGAQHRLATATSTISPASPHSPWAGQGGAHPGGPLPVGLGGTPASAGSYSAGSHRPRPPSGSSSATGPGSAAAAAAAGGWEQAQGHSGGGAAGAPPPGPPPPVRTRRRSLVNSPDSRYHSPRVAGAGRFVPMPCISSVLV